MEEQTNKRLHRSRDNRMIFGVAGGIGEFFNIDPTIIRIIFVVLAVIDGLGVIVYLAMAFLVPLEPATKIVHEPVGEDMRGRTDQLKKEFKESGARGKTLVGIIAIAIGIVLLIRVLFPYSFFYEALLWPLIIIGAGIYLLARK